MVHCSVAVCLFTYNILPSEWCLFIKQYFQIKITNNLQYVQYTTKGMEHSYSHAVIVMFQNASSCIVPKCLVRLWHCRVTVFVCLHAKCNILSSKQHIFIKHYFQIKITNNLQRVQNNTRGMEHSYCHCCSKMHHLVLFKN